MRQEHEHDPEPYMDPKATNLPPGIADVLSFKPFVLLESDHVALSWGRGDPAILVGSPNFVFTNRFAQVWIPGIYLLKPHDE